jgi:hypothetical protein
MPCAKKWPTGLYVVCQTYQLSMVPLNIISKSCK